MQYMHMQIIHLKTTFIIPRARHDGLENPGDTDILKSSPEKNLTCNVPLSLQ